VRASDISRTTAIFEQRSRKPPTIDEYHAEFLAAMRAQGVLLG